MRRLKREAKTWRFAQRQAGKAAALGYAGWVGL